MAAYFGESLKSFGINATADYSGSDGNGTFQMRAVVLDTANAGNILLAGAAVAIYGIMVSAPRLGESAQIVVLGETKVQLGGTVTAGQNLMTDANGNLVAQTSTNPIVGISRQAGGAGNIITAFIAPNL